MEHLADTLIEEGIEAETAEGRQTVSDFVRGVEERVHERVEVLEDTFGESARELVGGVMQQVRGYREEKLALLDPNYEVGDTHSEGAAAWYEPGTGRTVFDHTTMEQGIDSGYWKRTRRHEEVHHDQAHTFNQGAFEFRGNLYPVIPVLTEGQATQHQPESDLVASYRFYQGIYQQLMGYVGSGVVNTAVETGDVQTLQERILEKEGNAVS